MATKLTQCRIRYSLQEVFVNGKGMTPKQWLNSIGVGRNQTPKSTQVCAAADDSRSRHLEA